VAQSAQRVYQLAPAAARALVAGPHGGRDEAGSSVEHAKRTVADAQHQEPPEDQMVRTERRTLGRTLGERRRARTVMGPHSRVGGDAALQGGPRAGADVQRLAGRTG